MRGADAAFASAGRVSALFCVGIALNLVSIAAPGHYEHIYDHFMYVSGRSLGEVLGAIRWFDFSDVHYRPLSFALWNFLSFFLYETPVLFTLSSVLLSTLNGVLIHHLVLRASGQPRAAMWSFLAFSVFPAAAFAAGWFATAAEKLYLAFALCALHILLSDQRAAQRTGAAWSFASLASPEGWKLSRAEVLRQAGIALCLVLGLMSKETMLPFPAFVAGLCLLVRPWRGWCWSLLISSAIVAAYLLLRAQTMLSGNTYGQPPSLDNWDNHMLAYWLFPGVWDNFAVWDVRHAPRAQQWLAGILASLPVWLLMLRRKWRWALAYLGYYYVFVSPVLIHCCRAPQYLYAAALPMALAFAYAFRRGERAWVRGTACALFAALALHSAHIQWSFYTRAVLQQRAFHSTAAIVRLHDRRAGNTATKFAIRAGSEKTWQVIYYGFRPPHDPPGYANLGLKQRLTVHPDPGVHAWPIADSASREIPAGAVRLRIRPDGLVVEE